MARARPPTRPNQPPPRPLFLVGWRKLEAAAAALTVPPTDRKWSVARSRCSAEAGAWPPFSSVIASDARCGRRRRRLRWAGGACGAKTRGRRKAAAAAAGSIGQQAPACTSEKSLRKCVFTGAKLVGGHELKIYESNRCQLAGPSDAHTHVQNWRTVADAALSFDCITLMGGSTRRRQWEGVGCSGAADDDSSGGCLRRQQPAIAAGDRPAGRWWRRPSTHFKSQHWREHFLGESGEAGDL
jgi:hypothetical protein